MPIPSLTESDLIGELRNLTGEAQERRLAQAGITGARSEQLRTCLARGLLDQAVVLLERTTWSESRSPDAGGHPVKIDRYEIVELIGTGGMGSVYRAQQRYPIERNVALKLIKAGLDSREALARFDTERQALALMNHPHVARVLDAGTCETGQPYFVMEFVPGQSITSFCDRYNYTIRQRLELFLQACDAVQHAHQKAIIHRDLKSGNILVMLQDDQPVVKVIDFGLAKALGRHLTDRTLCTENGHLMGTPEYVSPEQVEGSADVDTRSDIYSLGVAPAANAPGTLVAVARPSRPPRVTM
jgi:serine/threonine protein kinase